MIGRVDEGVVQIREVVCAAGETVWIGGRPGGVGIFRDSKNISLHIHPRNHRSMKKKTNLLTFKPIRLKRQPPLIRRRRRKRPQPSPNPRSHRLPHVRIDADIVREFLALDPDFLAVGTVEVAAVRAGAPDESVVALDFPAFDGGGVGG